MNRAPVARARGDEIVPEAPIIRPVDEDGQSIIPALNYMLRLARQRASTTPR